MVGFVSLIEDANSSIQNKFAGTPCVEAQNVPKDIPNLIETSFSESTALLEKIVSMITILVVNLVII